MSALEIDGLSIDYELGGGPLRAVNNVSLSLGKGGILGIVGESGSGKSTLIKGVLGLLPNNGSVPAGRVVVGGTDFLGLGAEERRKLRWTRLSYVTQSAMDSLDPVIRIYRQFSDTWRAHRGGSEAEIRGRAEWLFRQVGLEPRHLDAYPHELSGGMRQRAIIALALLLDPDILIADEPTTGLDMIVQRQVLNLLRHLQSETHMSLVFISHDIAVIAELCHTVAIMYAGEVVEQGGVREVFEEPAHPYTIGLKQAFPDMRDPTKQAISIPGAPPMLGDRADGCAFVGRCPFAAARCHRERPVARQVEGRAVACHFAEHAGEFRARGSDPGVWQSVNMAGAA